METLKPEWLELKSRHSTVSLIKLNAHRSDLEIAYKLCAKGHADYSQQALELVRQYRQWNLPKNK